MAKNYNESIVKGVLMDEFGVPMDYADEQPEQQHLEYRARQPRTKDSVFDAIKAQFGEKSAQIAREHGWLKIPNIVEILRYAGKDLLVLQDYLDDMLRVHNIEASDTLNPIELLDRAGYKAWYVTNMKDQNKIAGYFRDTRAVKYGFTGGNSRSDKGEMICTVYTGLESGKKRFEEGWYVIHAVKKECWGDDKLPEDEWHIQPAEKGKESLDDEYSKSVISIQVSPSQNIVKIPQRYNHTIKGDADSGWHRNLEAIQPGLTRALESVYKVNLKHSAVSLPSYYVYVGDRTNNEDHIIKYNREINGVYIGDNFWCKGGNVKEFTKHQSLLFPNTDLVIDVKRGAVDSVADANPLLAKSFTEILQSSMRANDNKNYKLTLVPTKTGGMQLVLTSSNKISKEDIEKGNFEKSKAVKTVKTIIAEIEDGKIKYLNCMNAEHIGINNNKLFHDNIEFDFSGVKNLEITNCVLSSKTKMHLNPNANRISIDNLTNGKLEKPEFITLSEADFSNVQNLDLVGFDFSKASKLKFNPKANFVRLAQCNGLRGNLNFEFVKELALQMSDFKDANVKINSEEMEYLNLNGATGLRGDMDFCKVQDLNIDGVDWSKSNVDYIKLNHSTNIPLKGFSGVLDLSAVPDHDMFTNAKDWGREIDLSNLKKLKLNPNATYGFRGARIKADDVKVFKDMPNVMFEDYLTIKGVTKSEQCDISKINIVNFSYSRFRESLLEKLTIIGKWNQKNYLSGDLDFRNIKELELVNLDLTNANVKFNEIYEDGTVNLKWITGLQGTHNIKNIGSWDNCDLSHAYINCEYGGDKHITNVNGLNGYFRIRRNAHFSGTTFKETAKLDIKSQYGRLILDDTKGLTGTLYASNISGVSGADLSNVKIIDTGDNTSENHHLEAKNTKFSGTIDCTHKWVVKLIGCDLTQANLVFHPLASYISNQTIDLSRSVCGFKGEYDFSDSDHVVLKDTDFQNAIIRVGWHITPFEYASMGRVDLSGAKGTFVITDNISWVKKDIQIIGDEKHGVMDLSKAKIIMPNKKLPRFVMYKAIGPKGKLDLKNITKSVAIKFSDVSHTDILFNKNTNQVILENVKGLKGDLDFSSVKDLYIGPNVDLSNVSGIKIGLMGWKFQKLIVSLNCD